MIDEIYEQGTLTFNLNKEIYREEVLFKCFYWYGNEYIVNINSTNEKLFNVTISSKDNVQEINATHLIKKIKQDLIDFKLRDIITSETQTIRELIVAKAFAYYQSDSNPATEISDPVGFNPNEL